MKHISKRLYKYIFSCINIARFYVSASNIKEADLLPIDQKNICIFTRYLMSSLEGSPY